MTEELEYLDSDLKYSVPQVKSKTRSITYKGIDMVRWTSDGHHDHSKDVFYNGQTTPNPTEATPGDTVTINCVGEWPGGSIAFFVGWTSSSKTYIGAGTDLNDLFPIPRSSMNVTYSFTMPDDDIIVWCLCNGSTHTASV